MAKETRVEKKGKPWNGERERREKTRKNIEKMITTQRNLRRDQARGKFRCESNRGAKERRSDGKRDKDDTSFPSVEANLRFRNSGYPCYRVLFTQFVRCNRCPSRITSFHSSFEKIFSEILGIFSIFLY